MKELIDFSSLNEAFGLSSCAPVLVDWNECCEEFQIGYSGFAGNNHTKKSRKAISAARQGMVFSDKTKQKMSIAAKKRGENCSPETRKRLAEMKSKTYTLVDPNGILVTFTNLNKFCREHDLTNTCLSRVTRGVRNSYKGWTLP